MSHSKQIRPYRCIQCGRRVELSHEVGIHLDCARNHMMDHPTAMAARDLMRRYQFTNLQLATLIVGLVKEVTNLNLELMRKELK